MSTIKEIAKCIVERYLEEDESEDVDDLCNDIINAAKKGKAFTMTKITKDDNTTGDL